ncbi:MAG: hypothetical protein GKR88_10640 [Flavobacteriaceae bacterium]|nr:MAG: hypothetical protein GKR88_10640 [Flavobacteriaceae bacterium]
MLHKLVKIISQLLLVFIIEYGVNGSALDYQKVFLQFVKDRDLGLDLYQMEQFHSGTPHVREKWKKLTLSADESTVIEEPCTNN